MTVNAVEQRAHRTVTQGHDQRLATVEQLIERLSLNTEYLKAKSDDVAAKLAFNEVAISTVGLLAGTFQHRPFLARLSWFFLGR